MAMTLPKDNAVNLLLSFVVVVVVVVVVVIVVVVCFVLFFVLFDFVETALVGFLIRSVYV